MNDLSDSFHLSSLIINYYLMLRLEQTFSSLSSSIISQPKNKNTFSDFNGLRFLRVVMLKEVLSNNTMKGAQLNLIITIFKLYIYFLLGILYK